MDDQNTPQQIPPAQQVQQPAQSVATSVQPTAPQVTPESVVPQPITQPVDPATIVNKPIKELVDQIERDLLAHIYTNLKENKITGVAAQQLAREFLDLLPFKDKKDLVDKLSTLGQKYPEARQTYVNLGIPLEEQHRQERLDQMRAHIKAGDLDKALEVAKGGSVNANSNTSSTNSTNTSSV